MNFFTNELSLVYTFKSVSTSLYYISWLSGSSPYRDRMINLVNPL